VLHALSHSVAYTLSSNCLFDLCVYFHDKRDFLPISLHAGGNMKSKSASYARNIKFH